ncbi:unnamed protein product [Brassica rapa subsp. narinosa]
MSSEASLFRQPHHFSTKNKDIHRFTSPVYHFLQSQLRVVGNKYFWIDHMLNNRLIRKKMVDLLGHSIFGSTTCSTFDRSVKRWSISLAR